MSEKWEKYLQLAKHRAEVLISSNPNLVIRDLENLEQSVRTLLSEQAKRHGEILETAHKFMTPENFDNYIDQAKDKILSEVEDA